MDDARIGSLIDASIQATEAMDRNDGKAFLGLPHEHAHVAPIIVG